MIRPQWTMACAVTSSQLLLGNETLRWLHGCFELQKSFLAFLMVIRIYSNSRITSVFAGTRSPKRTDGTPSFKFREILLAFPSRSVLLRMII